MKKEIEMELPPLPNFIKSKEVSGAKGKAVIDIKEFNEEELRKMGSEWTEALIKHAEKRRSSPSKTISD